MGVVVSGPERGWCPQTFRFQGLSRASGLGRRRSTGPLETGDLFPVEDYSVVRERKPLTKERAEGSRLLLRGDQHAPGGAWSQRQAEVRRGAVQVGRGSTMSALDSGQLVVPGCLSRARPRSACSALDQWPTRGARARRQRGAGRHSRGRARSGQLAVPVRGGSGGASRSRHAAARGQAPQADLATPQRAARRRCKSLSDHDHGPLWWAIGPANGLHARGGTAVDGAEIHDEDLILALIDQGVQGGEEARTIGRR